MSEVRVMKEGKKSKKKIESTLEEKIRQVMIQILWRIYYLLNN